MNVRFALQTARRELLHGGRRLAMHMAAIAVGVAALVAIGGFRRDVERSVAGQARELLGADVVFRSNRPFPDSSLAVLDSLASHVPAAHLTSFASMALAPRTGRARLIQVRGVEPGWPWYGTITTDPTNSWEALAGRGVAIVDPAVLIQLDARIGDTLRIGEAPFVIVAEVTDRPGEIGLQTAIGARVYVPAADIEGTGLLTRGSRAFYRRYYRIDDNASLQRVLNTHNALFTREQVRFETASEQEDDVADALDTLARFLGLVGLAALLLGGVGVASAVNVFVRSRLDTVALLRCLGARQSTVFSAYVLLAAVLGALGAAVGVAAGVLVQLGLPRLLGDFLPVAVTPRPEAAVLLAGLGVGVWVALLFALFPLLALRNTPPLRALRRDVEPAGRRDPWRWVVVLALAASVIQLSLSQAPEPVIGFGFAGTVGATTLVLWVVALGLVRITRRLVPRQTPYTIRQGIANLYRPRNQTVAVTLALGFGVFLIGTLYVVQRNLLDQFSLDASPDRPNLALFDVQTTQLPGVVERLDASGVVPSATVPIVAARVAALGGRRVTDLLGDSAAWSGPRWVLRREYRHTWRDSLVDSEALVDGEWWEDERRGGEDGIARISIEQDIAADLRVTVGDTIVWDVQGVEIPSRIASIRRVDWARFAPNFFVVFAPGALEEAPATWVMLTRVDDPRVRAELQRDLVGAWPNVIALDLTLIQETVDRVIGRVTLAIRFMAFFSIAAGVLILAGALAASRAQRLREAVLLTTLGARARQVRRILLVEYAALGTLGALAGVLLAGIAGWLAVRQVFEMRFAVPVLGLGLLLMGGAALATLVGVVTGGEALRRPPLEALRAFGE